MTSTTLPLCTPEEFELDLSDFALPDKTKIFFEQIAGLHRCKLELDKKYQEVGSSVLQKPEYDSFGKSPMQEGPDLMTVEEVTKDAKFKKDSFDDLLKDIVSQMGLNPDEEILVNGERIPTKWGSYKVLTPVPIKSEERSRAKARNDYKGNAKFLCDIGRATIVCYTEDQVAQIIDELQKKSDVVRIKNRFAHPTYTGIRDVLMNVKVDGHVFEVQIHIADLLAADMRVDGHAFYEYFREYFVGTRESYQKREELFRELGEAVVTGEITEAIREILVGEDKKKLQTLEQITHMGIFGEQVLNLKCQKRLLSLLLKEGGQEKALLDGFHNMATVYKDQAEYRKALEWYQRALKGREVAFGKEHPDTLTTVHFLALVYLRSGEKDKALEWYQRALKGREAALGKEHPETLITVNNIATVYQIQKRYDQALQWHQRALKGREVALGKEHLETLISVNNICVVYFSQGEYDQALKWYQRVLRGREKTLGMEHPSTLTIVSSIAMIYRKQKEYDQALEWYQRALKGREAALGKEHPITLNTKEMMRHTERMRQGTALSRFVKSVRKVVGI